MSRIRPGRLLLTLFLLAFAVFFGLDLATQGMERVQGPADQVGKPAAVAHQPEAKPAGTAAGTKTASAQAAAGGPAASGAAKATTAPSAAPKTAATAQQAAKAQAAAPAGPPKIEVKESFLNHLSNRIGDALHHGARALIGAVVSVFDALVK